MCGLSNRFKWAQVGSTGMLVGTIFFLAGYAMFLEVLRENDMKFHFYELIDNLELKDTGLYGIIRHPMYTASAIMMIFVWLMLGSYIASTLYHSMKHHSKWKERLRRWDHAAIYWHIAGSYSPLTLVALRDQGYWGWSLFSFVWLCAIAGTITSFVHLKEHSNLETFCFVGMGLSVLVAFKPLIDSVSTAAVIWIIAEGVCYITGAVFYSLNKKKYMHSVFHFFVLAGSICHIIAVWDVLMEYL
jgi:hemolysin III